MTIISLPHEMIEEILVRVPDPGSFAAFVSTCRSLAVFAKDDYVLNAWAINTRQPISAARLGLPQAVATLLDRGDVDAETMKKMLAEACKRGCVEVARLLLDRGADPCASSRMLYDAILGDHLAVTQLLVDRGAFDNPITSGALEVACTNGKAEAACILIDQHTDEMKSDLLVWALFAACSRRQFHLAVLLLHMGADVRRANDLVLRWACHEGNLAMVRLFLDWGADVNAGKGLPLYHACRREHVEVIHELLGRYADVNVHDSYPLRQACAHDNICLARLLLERRAIVDTVHTAAEEDADGASEGNADDADTDSDANIVDFLYADAHADAVDCADLVAAANAANLADDPRISALCWACKNGNAELARLLLDWGADVDSNDGMALRWACEAQQFEVVDLLLKQGARVSEEEALALCLACENGNMEVVLGTLGWGKNDAPSCSSLLAVYMRGLEEMQCMLQD